MKPASRFLVGSLPVLTLLVSGMAMAGGGYNSTSPAMGTVQLASILCNVSSGSSSQGYVRNNSLNGAVSAAHLRRPGLCQSLAAYHSSQNQKGKHKAIGRHYGREASRTPSHNRVATNAVGQHKSRDSFKQEAWFMPDGSKQRRVTKHQARKQGWSGPEAMQAAHQARLDTMPSDETLMAQLQSSDSPADSAQSVSRLVPAMASLVTDGARYDSVETGLYKRQGQAPVPFKMVRNHGVIAIPQFEPGSDSAVASAEPKILVKKFRMVDDVMQPDTRFSDDGMEDFAVPLPAGDRVTAFTLDQDKLVVLSRPEADQGLSRVTLIDIDESDDAELVDSGASSGLWVKGELFRFHDDALYTVSQEEQKLFIYPDLASDSSQSLSSVRVVDLSSVGLSDGELVSALADGERCHVAVRRPDPGSDGKRIHLYQIDDGGAPPKETLVTDAGAQADGYQLHFVEGSLALAPVPSVDSGVGNLVFAEAAGEELASHKSGKSIQKRSAMDESPELDTALSPPVLQRQTRECPTALPPGFTLPPGVMLPPCNIEATTSPSMEDKTDRSTPNTDGPSGGIPSVPTVACIEEDKNTYLLKQLNCTRIDRHVCTSDKLSGIDIDTSKGFCVLKGLPGGRCSFQQIGTKQGGSCLYALHEDCNAGCQVSFTKSGTCQPDSGKPPPSATRNPPGCKLSSNHSPTGPMAVLIAVSAGLSAAALTTGFAGNEDKKRPGHDEPMEQDDDPSSM